MMTDDESLLSAYLDGQLGPEEQQAVEAALLDDPRLAEELRGLAVLRDLLAGLPRESPVDLTARVMRRVRRRAMLGTARGMIAWAPARVAGLVAVAAGVLAILALPWIHVRRDPSAGGGRDFAAARPDVEKSRPNVSAARWPSFSHAVHTPAEGPTGDLPRRLSEGGPGRRATSPPDELTHVREYLDHPQLRRIFLVSDPGDGSDVRRVASVVEQTTRFNYYKITVAQGLVFDPRHPDQATVFALVVGPRELDNLRDRLRTALNDRVDEQPAEPGVITRLADIGQVEACPPSPSADMQIPGDALAFREGQAGAVGEAAEPPPAEKPAANLVATPEQEYSSPVAAILAQSRRPPAGIKPDGRPAVTPGGQAPGGPARSEDGDQTLVVLVWVSRSRPG